MITNWDGEKQFMIPLHRAKMGLDVFLCCPGPSLADVDTSILRGPGRYVVALNTAYPAVKPDLWIGMDLPSCYDRGLWWEPFPKIVGNKFADTPFGGMTVKELPNVWLLSGTGTTAAGKEFFSRNEQNSWHIWVGNAYTTALHVCIWLGARTINLVGCDFGGKTDYHDGRKLSPEHRERNRILYEALVQDTRLLAEEGKAHGLELVSCTPDSPINTFLNYVPVERAIAAAEGAIPLPVDNRIWDSENAEMLQWSTQHEGDGVVVVADHQMEWMLPWWYQNLREHNPDVQIAFCDWGMTEEGKKWCAERGLVYPVLKPANLMHRKPFAILHAPFSRIICMDADCEIKADITPLFERGSMCVTEDPFNPWSKDYRPVPYSTGMIACHHGEPLIDEWARYVLQPELAKGEVWTDDQAFNLMIADMEEGLSDTSRLLVTLEPEWQWLRLASRSGDSTAKIIHWTGAEGKQIIDRKRKEASHGVERDSVTTGGEHDNPVVETGPLVSILMPAFNSSEFIEKAIQSCIDQTYQNWELIVLDDGSKDQLQTANIMQMMANKDKRIRPFFEHHRGRLEAHNRCWRLCKGDIIARLDSDDLQEPTRLAKQVAHLQNSTDSIVSCESYHIDRDGASLGRRPCSPFGNCVELATTNMTGSATYWHPPQAGNMITRSLYEAIGGLPGDNNYCTEEGFLYAAILLGHTIGHVPEALYVYRRYPEQMSQNDRCGADEIAWKQQSRRFIEEMRTRGLTE